MSSGLDRQIQGKEAVGCLVDEIAKYRVKKLSDV